MGDVTKIPVKFKNQKSHDRFLVHKNDYDCRHMQVLIDEKKAEVECANCGEKLNPMAVLSRLASEETRWHMAHKRYEEEIKRLGERSRTTCQHCKKMTKISRS